MIASRTYNTKLIRGILIDPEIYDRISDDSRAKLKINTKTQYWVKMEVDDELIGVYWLQPLNRWTVNIHAQILAKYREKHAFESGKAILQWFLDNTDYLKIVGEIPDCYPDVIKFTQKFGFQIEGCNRQSVMKNGKLIDQTLLGITRAEIEGGI